jgi:nitrite reductase/ring-hydroxylating ferredoxin subunit
MSESIPRRAFVRRLPVLTVGLAAGASTASLSACAGAAYVTPRMLPNGNLLIATPDVAERGEAFLQTTSMQRPVYLRRGNDGTWSAVLASCTHRGCQPEPAGDRLACPCHGSEFSFEGEVLTGPADRPLPRYEVIEEGDRLVVILPDGAGR